MPQMQKKDGKKERSQDSSLAGEGLVTYFGGCDTVMHGLLICWAARAVVPCSICKILSARLRGVPVRLCNTHRGACRVSRIATLQGTQL